VKNLARTDAEVGERRFGLQPLDPASNAAKLMPAVKLDEQVWFVLQTRYRFEKKVAARLSDKGLEVFLPLRKEKREWNDRCRDLLVPLFPGHVFVRSPRSLALRLLVLQTPGAMGFVASCGTAAIVPRQQIRSLQLLLAADIPFSVNSFLRSGPHVRVRSGCLQGVEGLLDEANKSKLVISVESLRCSLAFEIHDMELEVI